MILILLVALLAVMIWVECAAWRVMSAAHDNRHKRLVYVALALVGLLTGMWCGFFLEYRLSPGLRCASFPIPAAVFHLEGGQWVDFITPAPGLIVLLNMALVTASTLFPWSLRTVLRHRRVHRRLLQGLCPSCGYDLTGNVSGICPECGEKVVPRQSA